MEQFWAFFAFPLNLLLAVIWMAGWGWLWKNRPQCKAVRFMLSPAATISAIALLLGSCLWVGFSGMRDFVQSVFFAAVLLYVQTVIFLVILRGWKRKDGVVRWRFLLLHAGMLLAAGAGFWGAPDSCELRVMLERGQETETAYVMDGGMTGLGYTLHLVDYKAEMSADGKPSHYEAVISVDGGEHSTITVNHPYNAGFGEDIYLASIADRHCILQIVREPWRYFALAGIIMLLAGAFLLFIKGPQR